MVLALLTFAVSLLLRPLPTLETELGQPVLATDPAAAETADVLAATPEVLTGPAPVEAEQHLNEVLRAEPIKAEAVDHFVTATQRIELPTQGELKTQALSAWRTDTALKPDALISVLREVSQVESLTAADLLREQGVNLEQTVSYVEDGQTVQATVHDLLDLYLRQPEAELATPEARDAPRPVSDWLRDAGAKLTAPVVVADLDGQRELPLAEALQAPQIRSGGHLPVVVARQHVEPTTLAALGEEAKAAGTADPAVTIIQGRQGLNDVTVRDLLGPESASGSDESIYYVRTVQPSDRQGVWGIVQFGLMENFARGVALKRNEQLATYRVAIPKSADEPEGKQSSFLGRLIQAKVRASHVFNYQKGLMGGNPNLILPGQELVIVEFTRQELLDIYSYFAGLSHGQ